MRRMKKTVHACLSWHSGDKFMGFRQKCTVIILLAFSLLLTACIDTAPSDPLELTLTAGPILPTVTPRPTATLTPVPVDYKVYTHRTGVFNIAYPSTWEVLDSSTDTQLNIRLLPPAGFGSRVTVEITNAGDQAAENTPGRAESYIFATYGQNSAYTEASRTVLPDGRLQAIFQYQDGQGGKGTETLILQQAGVFFVALRTFLAASDPASQSTTLDTIAASLNVNATAAWGNSIAAINPAEVLLINTNLWQDRAGNTYYMGELYNASPSTITDVQVSISLCDSNGIVVTETTAPAGLRTLGQGGTIPFSITLKGVPRGSGICDQKVLARPVAPDADYTTKLEMQVSSTRNRRNQLVLRCNLLNPGLSPLRRIHLVAAVYDDSGKVIGYDTYDSPPYNQLGPGQATAIDLTIPALNGKADHFVVLVEAEISHVISPLLSSSPTPELILSSTPAPTAEPIIAPTSTP